ncbi:MAG: endonuclease [Anaerolineae bacterium]|nr:endonuclease [Anaerolineae bacterium]
MISREKNRYVQLIESIFFEKFKEGDSEITFSRDEIVQMAEKLKIVLPKNLGDVVYSFRYRTDLPETISEKAKEGYEWMIRSAGRGKYKFVLTKEANFLPNPNIAKIKIPDSTPGIVSRYSFDDEQALLAKIRYNRLIDIFTGVTCYSLQNHLRTTLSEIGQVETDEIYVGIDKQGIHYVFPVQAKGSTDKLGAVQIEQDFSVCSEKYANAIGRPIAAQFMDDETIILFEFVLTDEGVRILTERHYLLVHPDDLSESEVREYRNRVHHKDG